MRRETLICDRCGKPASELIEFDPGDGNPAQELDRRCLYVRLNEMVDLTGVTAQRREAAPAVARMRARR